MSVENIYHDLVYKYFKQNFYENKKFEDLAGYLVLDYFNNNVDSENKYYISKKQHETNYKKMLYDLELHNKEDVIKIEVKTDHKSKITNNFFIEFKQYGKASGIMTTEADFYIINDGIKYYLITVERLKMLIKTMEENGTLKKNKHMLRINNEVIIDGNNIPFITEGFLIPKNIIINASIILN